MWEWFGAGDEYILCAYLVAVIGFVAGVYSVRRSEGSVSVMVGVLQGQLGAPVTVTISTYSGTASGECSIHFRSS